MEKKILNEHDFSKKMIDVIRGYVNRINEDETRTDTISPEPGDAIYNDELKQLQEKVSKSARITNFKIYPMDENVIIEGILFKGEAENSGIKFKMSLKARELETTMVDVELDDEVSTALKYLKGYYKNWCDEWYTKIITDYKPRD